VNQDRKTLRAQMRRRRTQIPANVRITAAQSLAKQLLALPFASDCSHVAGYWAIDGEIALHAWQLALPTTVQYCLPLLHHDGRLRFAPWRAGQPIQANRYGIPEPQVETRNLLEPEAMGLVIIPLVAFDAHRNRLGMGAGWYDRSFAFRSSRYAPPWLVGAAFGLQQVETLPVAAWDVPLDAVCTEVTTHLPLTREPA